MAFLYVIIASISSYVLASIALFYFPEILHKRKTTRKVIHISHRGGAGENYENTLGAFAHAVNFGTDMLELDCHLTKDKQVVVVHDSTLKRITGHEGKIKEFNYNQLPLLKTSINIDFEPGKYFSGAEDEGLRKIPLLKDVFESFPDVVVNIDVKEGSDELIEEIGKLITAHKREKMTIWGSFREDASLRCYKQNPEVGRYFSKRGVMKLYFYFYTGLLAFIPLCETHLEIPMLSTREARILPRHKSFFPRLRNFLMIRPTLFRHLRERGIPIYIWVLNTEEDFQLAMNAGVDGIITDYPSKLRRFFLKQKFI